MGLLYDNCVSSLIHILVSRPLLHWLLCVKAYVLETQRMNSVYFLFDDSLANVSPGIMLTSSTLNASYNVEFIMKSDTIN